MTRACGTLAAAIIIVTAGPLAPTAARAGTAEDAARAFDEGARAFAAGDYVAAAAAFERAYAAKPHPSALWNGARARHRMGDPAGAANLYARYLDEAPPGAPDRDHALASLNELARSLARIEVHAGAGVTDVHVDDTPLIGAGGVRWVVPGEHKIRGRSPRGDAAKVVRATAGERLSVTLDPPPPPSDAAGAARTSSGGLHWGFAAAGGVVAIALGGVTVWSGLDTVAQKDVFDETGTEADLDEGRSRQLRTNVLLAATGVVAVATIVSLFFVDYSPSRVGFDPRSLRVRF